uniref:Uncharacterized protein n=1 Tax=Kalanchoe fedtschenkoi TaxID=63787 RepID=A0A7N0UDE3_KALFE
MRISPAHGSNRFQQAGSQQILTNASGRLNPKTRSEVFGGGRATWTNVIRSKYRDRRLHIKVKVTKSVGGGLTGPLKPQLGPNRDQQFINFDFLVLTSIVDFSRFATRWSFESLRWFDFSFVHTLLWSVSVVFMKMEAKTRSDFRKQFGKEVERLNLVKCFTRRAQPSLKSA